MATNIPAEASFGIAPIPPQHRSLGLWDSYILWADLGVSFLVMVVGVLIAPSLGLSQTLLAIVAGAVIGNLLLGIAAVIGSDTGAPAMVLLRPALGVRGSYLASAVNVLQLIGWATFEIVIMGLAADGVSATVFGFSSPVLWTVIFALITTGMALYGPVQMVKQWMEKVAVWVVLATTVWLTIQIFRTYDVMGLLGQPGAGGMSFWQGVDLVVALPISWMPLVADYSRFSRRSSDAFWGAGLGYFTAQVWFYALGAVLVLTLAVGSPAFTDLFTAISVLAGGVLVLLIVLVDEADEGFANIYSTAISAQNIMPWASQRVLIAVVGGICSVLAVTLIVREASLLQYELFLLLIGAAFVPLMGLLAADYFVVRRRQYDLEAMYKYEGIYWYSGGVNWWAMAAWALGVGVYLMISGMAPFGIVGPWASIGTGATLPGFAVAFAAYAGLGRVAIRKRDR